MSLELVGERPNAFGTFERLLLLMIDQNMNFDFFRHERFVAQMALNHSGKQKRRLKTCENFQVLNVYLLISSQQLPRPLTLTYCRSSRTPLPCLKARMSSTLTGSPLTITDSTLPSSSSAGGVPLTTIMFMIFNFQLEPYLQFKQNKLC